jgi:FkbM family methyltransferase
MSTPISEKITPQSGDPLRQSAVSHALEGGDLILASLLRNVEHGTYIDVGANHPVEISSTFGLYKKGWTGLAVDGNAAFAAMWAECRPNDQFVQGLLSDTERDVEFRIFPDDTMSSMDAETSQRYAERYRQDDIRIEKMRTARLADFRKTFLPEREIHLLAVDVEGEDMKVLIGADLQEMRPGVIAVETKNCSLYNPMENSIVKYLTELGYRLVAKTPLDAFFVLPEKSYLSWIPKSLL